jgi:hypothetical protein
MAAFVHHAGVFTVRYQAPDDLSPSRQRELEGALRAASLVGPVGLVFVVGGGVKVVDPVVPAYWLGLTGDELIRIAAMAIVTSNPGVSIATRGFSVANTLRDHQVQVRPFQEEAEAQAWVAGVLAGG